MRLRTPPPELVRQTERLVARMPPGQVVREVASRTEDPIGLGGNWRHTSAPEVEDFAAGCLIVQKEGEAESGLISFDLWEAQREALEVIERERFLALPKGRQVGVTWLELMAMLHAGTFWGHRLFNIARQSEKDARGAITRLLILAGYDPNSDPPHMRVLPESALDDDLRPRIVGKTLTSLTFENGSHFQAKTATRAIARGDASFWTLCDEYAFWPWPEKQLAALEHGAHRVHVPSTGDGDADAFAKLCAVAQRGKSKWRVHFIPATADPRRDAAWFRQNVDEAPDPDLANRELARDITDVFRPREGAFFKRFKRADNVREFDVVPGWQTETCVDWGLAHPAALFIQISPLGQPFVFDEYMPTDIRTTDFGVGMLEKLVAHSIAEPARGPFSDPAGKNRNTQTRRSEFDVFRDLGMRPEGRTSKVLDGVTLMMESIGHPDPEQRLIMHSRCVGLIAALSNVQAHRNDDDIYDTDHAVYSHPLDALRYWHVCRYRRRGADPDESGISSASGGERARRSGGLYSGGF